MSYVPHTDEDRRKMMALLGIERVEELFSDIPETALVNGHLELPPALSEPELMSHLKDLTSTNGNIEQLPCFLGAGAYNHFIPAVVDHLSSRGELLTSYTPYQPELSQGMLQSIYEFQTLIARLTGMDVANASMYEAGTAVVEACFLSRAATRRKKILVSRGLNPEYRSVLSTYALPSGLEVVEIETPEGVTALEGIESALDGETAALVIQNPNFFGCLEDLEAAASLVQGKGALLVTTISEPVSLGLLKPPGECGADMVVGEGQALGNPVAFGGPYLGFFAARGDLLKKLPGRLSGATVDAGGKRGYVMTLQTREQHIRRARATSNICTNQALTALRTNIYLAALGSRGLREAAELSAKKAHYAMNVIRELPGFEPTFDQPFFNEFAVRSPAEPSALNRRLLGEGIIGGLDLGTHYPEHAGSMLICVTEQTVGRDIDRLAEVMGGGPT